MICTTAEDSDYDKALRDAFGDRYFRNDKRANEMTRGDYEDLAARIYESFDKQGIFNRIKSAVETAEKSRTEPILLMT